MLVEGRFFHDSLAQGPNFTSVRNGVIANNIFSLPARHGASFWQETDNPLLGSSHNPVAHNLLVTSQDYRQALGFTNNSADDRIVDIIAVGIMAATSPST